MCGCLVLIGLKVLLSIGSSDGFSSLTCTRGRSLSMSITGRGWMDGAYAFFPTAAAAEKLNFEAESSAATAATAASEGAFLLSSVASPSN